MVGPLAGLFLLALAASEDPRDVTCDSDHCGVLTGQSLLQKKLQFQISAETLWQRMWDGEDLTRDEHNIAMGHLRSSGASLLALSNASMPLAIRVAGFFGSGTNLMAAFLQENFGDEAFGSAGFCDDKSAKRARTQPCCDDFWKHTHPLHLASYEEKPNESRQTAVVVMIRNPMSQLVSWGKQSFNLWPCQSSWFSGACECSHTCDGVHCAMETPNFFPCSAPAANSSVDSLLKLNFGAPPDASADDSVPQVAYEPGGIGAWNSYVAGYRELVKAKVALPMHIVRYEDLVIDPESVLKSLADALKTSVPGEVHVLEDNQRTFVEDTTASRTESVDKITTKAYRNEISSENLQRICDHLDADLLAEFGYGDECPAAQ